MGIRIEFKGGITELKGDGTENLKYSEHELIIMLSLVIGGKTVDEKYLETNRTTLDLTTEGG